jgi:hypothetical protein
MIITETEYKKIQETGEKFLREQKREYEKIIDEMIEISRTPEGAIYLLNYPHPLWWYSFEKELITWKLALSHVRIYYGEWKRQPKHKEKIEIINEKINEIVEVIDSFEFNYYETMANVYELAKSNDILLYVPAEIRDEEERKLNETIYRLIEKGNS